MTRNKNLREIYRWVEERFAARRFDEIDAVLWLVSLGCTHLDEYEATGLIRVTCRAMAALPHRKPAYERILEEHDGAGKNKGLFVGLPELMRDRGLT